MITSNKNMKAVNLIHLKYVDDLTMAETINLPSKLVAVPDSVRPLPDSFHARTGHVLPEENSKVHEQLMRTSDYAARN